MGAGSIVEKDAETKRESTPGERIVASFAPKVPIHQGTPEFDNFTVGRAILRTFHFLRHKEELKNLGRQYQTVLLEPLTNCNCSGIIAR